MSLTFERAAEIADQRNAESLEKHKKDLTASTHALLPVIEDYLNDGASDDFLRAIAEIVRGNSDKAMYVGRATPAEYITRTIKTHLEKYAKLSAPTTDEEQVLREHEAADVRVAA